MIEDARASGELAPGQTVVGADLRQYGDRPCHGLAGYSAIPSSR